MSKSVIPFSFEGNAVRIVTGEDGESWFVLTDVCRVLELGSPHKVVERLDDDEKTTLDTRNTNPATSGVGIDPRAQALTIISESGLYSLILTSRKPAAKRFKKWVTAEVLPSIRKTGAYHVEGVRRVDPAFMDRLGTLMDQNERIFPMFADLSARVSQIEEVLASRRFKNDGAESELDLLPSGSTREWLAAIRLAATVRGRAAALELWRRSPLPQIEEHEQPAMDVGSEPADCLGRLLVWEGWRPGGPALGIVLNGLEAMTEGERQQLAGVGIRLSDPCRRPGLIVANNHPKLRECFDGTRWQGGNWRFSLLNLPGARIADAPMSFGGRKSRAVVVPLDLVTDAEGERQSSPGAQGIYQ